MPGDPESLYRQLGRIIETMPVIPANGPLPTDALLWLGRAEALVNEAGPSWVASEITLAIQHINSAARRDSLATISLTLYRALGAAELQAPASAKGAFIPVGNAFDAFAALSKLLQSARDDVLIVDPYMDETVLTEFGGAVPKGVGLRLMTDRATHKPMLATAAKRWVSQYGSGRPLQVRLAPAKSLHDRAILIDKATAWTLTQSLKDFAKRSPAEIVRADDIAPLKIEAYETIWIGAEIVV